MNRIDEILSAPPDTKPSVEIDGVQHRMSADDTTWVLAEVPHRFIDASDTNKMRSFWIYASIDPNRTIIAPGETRLVDSERG